MTMAAMMAALLGGCGSSASETTAAATTAKAEETTAAASEAAADTTAASGDVSADVQKIVDRGVLKVGCKSDVPNFSFRTPQPVNMRALRMTWLTTLQVRSSDAPGGSER